MQLLATLPHLTLYLHEGASRALEAQWQGAVGNVMLRRATLECATLARAHDITGWVADDRLLGSVRQADLEWTALYVLPLLVKQGVRRFARLEAVDPDTQQLVAHTQDPNARRWPFDLRVFTDVWAARAWACG